MPKQVLYFGGSSWLWAVAFIIVPVAFFVVSVLRLLMRNESRASFTREGKVVRRREERYVSPRQGASTFCSTEKSHCYYQMQIVDRSQRGMGCFFCGDHPPAVGEILIWNSMVQFVVRWVSFDMKGVRVGMETLGVSL